MRNTCFKINNISSRGIDRINRSLLAAALAILVLPVFVLPVNAASLKLESSWVAEGVRTPESVLVYEHGKDKFLFVAEIEGDGAEADGEGGIAKLSMAGKILEPNWVRGLDAPKGMGVYDGKLYVADIDEVVVIDIASQEIKTRIPIAGAKFLNDVAVDKNGVVYVSDTQTKKVHRIVANKPETFLSDVDGANGLFTMGDKLVVGAGPTLLLVDAQGNSTEIAKGFESGIDGVEMIGKDEFIVSCWIGLIYHVKADGNIEKLLDSRDSKANTADIGYDKDKRIVFVPDFKNSVTAYQLR